MVDILRNTFNGELHIVSYAPGTEPSNETIATCSRPLSGEAALDAYAQGDPIDASSEGYTAEWAQSQPFNTVWASSLESQLEQIEKF